jgi:large subunit ribosomal protein L25
MEEVVLKGELRQIVGKQVKALRREGRLPAVIYGMSSKPMAITLDMREASRILPTITSSHLIVVDLDGQKHNALVREKQRNPVSGHLIHVDFQEVSMTEKLRTTVMIELQGEAPAVKNLNGVVVTGVERLDVESLPGDLPERILVDLSKLNEIGDAIYVRDIVLPPAVEVLTNLEEMVALVTAPVMEEEPEAAEGEEAEPEVIERGKKEEEEI